MWRERGLQMYHAVLFHYGTDGGDAGIMAVVGEGYRSQSDFGAFFESLQFVFKDIEAHLQMLGINNAEQRLARHGCRIERCIELGHHTRNGCLDGTVSQLMFQLAEGSFCGVIAAVDACHLTDVLRCLVEGSALIALAHQDVLILVFGMLQFRAAF